MSNSGQDGILRSAFAQQHQQQASELQAIMGLALASKTFAAQFRPCSFSADTVVTTEDGFISIAEITENDHVLAYDEKTGKSNFYSVLAMMKHLDLSLYMSQLMRKSLKPHQIISFIQWKLPLGS